MELDHATFLKQIEAQELTTKHYFEHYYHILG